MKKRMWLILLVCGYAGLSATAQIRKVPARVTNSMHTIYPTAKNVEWHDKLTRYKADFDLNGTPATAKFNRRGHWKKTEMQVPEYQLPATIREGLGKSKYRNWDVRSSSVTCRSGERTKYHVRVARNDLRKKELVFTTRGQLMKDNMTL